MPVKQASSEDAGRIESLRELLSLVVANTKRENAGKAPAASKEDKALTQHIGILLGRTPTPEEVAHAKRF